MRLALFGLLVLVGTLSSNSAMARREYPTEVVEDDYPLSSPPRIIIDVPASRPQDCNHINDEELRGECKYYTERGDGFVIGEDGTYDHYYNGPAFCGTQSGALGGSGSALCPEEAKKKGIILLPY